MLLLYEIRQGLYRSKIGVSLTLPAGYHLSTQAGPDFNVHHVVETRTLGEEESARAGFYVGYHPSSMMKEFARTAPGQIAKTERLLTVFGAEKTWQCVSAGNGGLYGCELFIELEGALQGHLFVSGSNSQSVDGLMAILCAGLNLGTQESSSVSKER